MNEALKPAVADDDIVTCDACPVLCRIRLGRTGACDRYGNVAGKLTRLDPFVITQNIAARRAAGATKDDALQVLMDSRYSDGAALTPNEITGILTAAMFAGHHTSSGTAAWTLIELLRHPEWLGRVVDEIDALHAGDAPLSYQSSMRRNEIDCIEGIAGNPEAMSARLNQRTSSSSWSVVTISVPDARAVNPSMIEDGNASTPTGWRVCIDTFGCTIISIWPRRMPSSSSA